VDNRAIAQVLGEIADLLEIKGDNAFKIRAYRSASETMSAWPDPVSRLDEKQLRDLPGIGKDLAAKVRELVDTGACGFHAELLQQFPATILDVLRLQGVGPKTVALLYSALGIRSLDDLAAAAREGRLRTLKGMGARKEAMILKAIAEREKDVGRHLLADTAVVAADVIAHLKAVTPDTEFIPVGSVRRGCETCGDIDILAIGGDSTLMETFTAHPRVERVLGQGDTKSSVLLSGGYQVDLRLVPAASRGAAMQYFTGSKAHNVSLRERAIQRGYKLNEYGLYRTADDQAVAGESEEGLYAALGLAWIPPELREDRGEIVASDMAAIPPLVAPTDLRGDLHMHSNIAITDHSKALAMANGLDETRALEHAARIRALNGRFEGLTVLAGIECDILEDGRMDLANDCLAQLDFVIASVHSRFNQDEAAMTDRVLRALECPYVDVLGHPTGRLLLKREPVRLHLEQVATAAARLGVALEINCQTDRLDLNDACARLAYQRGARLVISTDAHSVGALANMRWGVTVARRAWLPPDAVLNTRSADDLRPLLRRHRQG
jgi:DNA polymerase (family 10)